MFRYILPLMIIIPLGITGKLIEIYNDSPTDIHRRSQAISNEVVRINNRLRMYEEQRIDKQTLVSHIRESTKRILYELGEGDGHD